MSIDLGFSPDRLSVKLSRFGDFTSALIFDDGNPATPNEWPDGTVIELRFYSSETSTVVGASWPATIVDDRASWHVLKAVTGALLDSGNTRARLFYALDGTELEWAIGSTKDVK
ncbi:MAG TPA: hypothetical protein VIQ30_09880 [Pseudonocardia sp.]